ncbi:hypothetical protein [uncultured Arthrobacter sp.]|uniref:hypothetical protein n=1 Tax=uncultured Arthrobacter sp. TaxID=114050 RepID=UPI00262EF442|nr:hypothetical protein [uncultured Arthrobacter sp.]
MADSPEKNWLQNQDSPQLKPGRDLSEVPLQRLHWAFTKASSFHESQVTWFQGYTPDTEYVSKSSGTIHEFSLSIRPPVDEWALLTGEILNQLSSARDNLFRDVVKRASGFSDEEIRNNFRGGVHWPLCFTEKQWISVMKKYSFIPEVIMDRVRLFQPFRDLRPDGKTPDEEWMKAGASTWARFLNNQDKHDEPVRVTAHHYLGGPVTAESEFILRKQPRQRWDYTDPQSNEPLITIYSEPIEDLRIIAPAIDVVVTAKGPSKIRWDPLNSGLWSALLESQLVINTVYYGREKAQELSIPIMEYAPPKGWTDFRYVLQPGGGYKLTARGNYAQEALNRGFV